MNGQVPETTFARAADGTYLAYQVSGEGPLDVVFLIGGGIPVEDQMEGRECASFIRGNDQAASMVAMLCAATHPERVTRLVMGTRAEDGDRFDRVLATVLFTDIVNSTAQAADLGDRAWRERLDDHDAMVRSELERFRGREIKTTGDGFVATFDGPARAIRSACAIRDGARSLGIDIRAGLHTGEVELRDTDIGGISVHTAARVQAIAGPGEVLVSRTVVDLGGRFWHHVRRSGRARAQGDPPDRGRSVLCKAPADAAR